MHTLSFAELRRVFGVLRQHHSKDVKFLSLIVANMAQSAVDWRCAACWRTNKAHTQKCARCGIKWTHGNDPTYTPQKDPYRPKSPRRDAQSSSWQYTAWGADSAWDDAAWGAQTWSTSKKNRGSTPRRQTPRSKKGKNASMYNAPPPEPPWHSQYTGDAASTPAGVDDAANETLVILATALKESNTTVPERVQHIVEEHSVQAPTSKGLKNAVDKMDKARKKLKEAQKARASLHANWNTYISDSMQRWTQFAEQFTKDDQNLADKVKAAQERLQQTKEDVESKKAALDDLDSDGAVEVTDDEMPDKLDTAESIRSNIEHMVGNLKNLQKQAEAASIELGESKQKRPRLEEGKEPQQPDGGDGSAGFQSPSMVPFAKPGKQT